MDVQYPYASVEARLRLLYRLPLPRERKRQIQVGERSLGGPEWLESPHHLSVEELLRGQGEVGSGVDVVGLPGAVDACADEAQVMALLRAAHGLLRPGGVVVGHCQNPWALKVLRHRLGWRHLRRLARIGGPVGSAASCVRVLNRAGFLAVQCGYVQPDLSDPMGLIPSQRDAARAQFLRVTRAERGHFAPPAYALRIGLAWAGWGGAQQREVFYWGQKAC